MFCINPKNNKITLTRGDDVALKIDIEDYLGKGYIIKPTDVITFTLKKSPSANTAALQLTGTEDHYIVFAHDDTKDLKTGNYIYDVELITNTNQHYTVIPTSYFELAMEVSR